MTVAEQFRWNDTAYVLVVNGGSSSIRFALYGANQKLCERLVGKIERIGHPNAHFSVNDADGKNIEQRLLNAKTHTEVISFLLDWLADQALLSKVIAVGHRIVHGMQHTQPETITPALVNDLRRFEAFDPEHLPTELEIVAIIQKRCPAVPQIACFDTAFHRNLPQRAKLLPIPRRYQAQGIERYGFHGISYSYLMEELAQQGDAAVKQGKMILAHLGSGASMAAIRDGQCIDTSMGFTPTAGLMMSTRTGDLDPGLYYFLSQSEQLSAAQLQHMMNHESGLLGVSELSADIRDLLDQETHNRSAAEAIELFCYQAQKWLGAFTAALGGLNTLVFTGGIGENAASIRARICAELEFLGINLNAARNANHESIISSNTSKVTVRVMRTNEELMIARSVCRLLHLDPQDS